MNIFKKNVIKKHKMIKIIKFKKINNIKGNIVKILSSKDKYFKKINEIYFSYVKHKSVKAWKKHNKIHLNLLVLNGKVKFVFYDGKKKFQSISITENSNKRIYIPSGVWFGFKGLNKKNLILSISSGIASEKEISRKNINEIKYYW